MLKINQRTLNDACRALDISQFNEDDITFLQEYRDCLKVVAIALKSLEGQKHAFGLYLPVLSSIRACLHELRSQYMQYCVPLINALEAGFYTRFDAMMNSHVAEAAPLYIGMVVNPVYKLNYLRMNTIPTSMFDNIVKLLYNECKSVLDAKKNKEQHKTNENDGSSLLNGALSTLLVPKDVSSSLSGMPETGRNASIMDEIIRYLKAPTSNDINEHLHQFPLIRDVYIKYSCIRTSEAICERMFSYAS